MHVVNPNHGASSLFKPTKVYDPIEPLISSPIVVESTRLDTYIDANGVQPFELMWLDAQGAELSIIKSLGEYLSHVRTIWTEYEHQPIYEHQPLLPELRQFLTVKGFRWVYQKDQVVGFWGDACFIRE
jgi:hypothetical protein